MSLRRKSAPLKAYRLTKPESSENAEGTLVAGKVGDWKVMNGTVCLQILTDKEFPGPYEIVPEGAVTLSKADRERIEGVAGIGATQNGASLLLAIQRLARIGIGDVQIPFTPGQLEEIQWRAQKRGITVERAIQDVIDRIKDELFHRG